MKNKNGIGYEAVIVNKIMLRLKIQVLPSWFLLRFCPFSLENGESFTTV